MRVRGLACCLAVAVMAQSGLPLLSFLLAPARTDEDRAVVVLDGECWTPQNVCKVCGLEPDPVDPGKHQSCVAMYRAGGMTTELSAQNTLATIDLTFDTLLLPRSSCDAARIAVDDERILSQPYASVPFKVPI